MTSYGAELLFTELQRVQTSAWEVTGARSPRWHTHPSSNDRSVLNPTRKSQPPEHQPPSPMCAVKANDARQDNELVLGLADVQAGRELPIDYTTFENRAVVRAASKMLADVGFGFTTVYVFRNKSAAIGCDLGF